MDFKDEEHFNKDLSSILGTIWIYEWTLHMGIVLISLK